MRVAWVLYGDLAQRTGGTIYDHEVVRALRAHGDEVRVVSLDAAAARSESDAALVAKMTDGAPDVVVGDELCFPELARAFPGLSGPRRVLLVHHLSAWETEQTEEARAALRAREQRAIEACDRIVVTSQTTRQRLVAEGIPARVAVDVVLPGADRLGSRGERGGEREREREGGRERGGGGGGGLRFLFVGSVVARKRVATLVRAFAGGVEHEDARLVVLGSTARDEAHVAEVRRLIVERGLGARVELLGECDEGAVRRQLEDADVLVMPSTLEGYGIAATEAIFAGVPVIAARAQGLAEALAPCPEACTLVDDEAALEAALRAFAEDPALRARRTAAAQAASMRMPTWAQCGDGFRDVLRKALAADRDA